jgi:hypothetical protein
MIFRSLMKNREMDANTRMKTKGLSVYSVTIGDRPVMGLEIKFEIPYALPLNRIGKTCWLIW